MAHNQNPGEDEAQAQKDRGGFRIDAEHTTGGKSLGVDELPCGPEVGNPYDGDELGEEYKGVTYKGGDKGKKAKSPEY